MDTIFYEDFISPLCTPKLPFSREIKLRDTTSSRLNDNTIVEKTGGLSGQINSYKNEDLYTLSHDIYSNIETLPTSQSDFNSNLDSSTDKISTSFADVSKLSEDLLSCPEYLNAAHELN